jgi:uncharacterized membrane protein YhfC
MKIENNNDMTTKNKAATLLLILFSTFSQSFFYKKMPWYNVKTGIILTILVFIGMTILVLKIGKNRKSIYLILGIALLFLIAQFFI